MSFVNSGRTQEMIEKGYQNRRLIETIHNRWIQASVKNSLDLAVCGRAAFLSFHLLCIHTSRPVAWHHSNYYSAVTSTATACSLSLQRQIYSYTCTDTQIVLIIRPRRDVICKRAARHTRILVIYRRRFITLTVCLTKYCAGRTDDQMVSINCGRNCVIDRSFSAPSSLLYSQLHRKCNTIKPILNHSSFRSAVSIPDTFERCHAKN